MRFASAWRTALHYTAGLLPGPPFVSPMTEACSARAACIAHHLRRGRVLVPDRGHRRCSAACPLWRHERSVVCLASLNVHVCGSECALPARVLEAGEGYACPLTLMVRPCPVLVQVPTFDSYGRITSHWSHPTRRARVVRPRVCATQVCGLVHDVLVGRHRAVIRATEVARAAKNAGKAAKRLRRTAQFSDVQAIMSLARRASFAPTRFADPARVRAVGLAIHGYLLRHPTLCLGSPDVSVCTLLSVLSTGLAHAGTTIVPRCPVVVQNLPSPSLMGRIPRVHCRAISVGTRRLKRYVLTQKGTPVFGRVFPGF